MSLLDHPISQPSLDISRYHSTNQETTTPSSVDRVGKFVFLVLVPYGVWLLSSDDFNRDTSLVQDLIHVEF
jgi:hypothetical protein